MKSKWKIRVLSMVLAVMMALTATPVRVEARGMHLNRTKITINEGETARLKVAGANGKVKWSSSKTSVASVSQKGVIKAKNEGTAIIKAKVKNKVLKCKVIVEAEDYDDEWDEDYDDSSSQAESSTPLDEVKAYIKNYGSTNMNGDPIIQMESGDSTYTIIYDLGKDRLEFSLFMMGDVGGVATIDTVHIDCPSDMNGSATFEESIAAGIGSMRTSGSLNVATYKGGSDARVTVEDKTKDLATLSDADIAEMTQARVETLIIACDVLLHKETGYYLKDIGFNSYI